MNEHLLKIVAMHVSTQQNNVETALLMAQTHMARFMVAKGTIKLLTTAEKQDRSQEDDEC
jgi:hypothetical protein